MRTVMALVVVCLLAAAGCATDNNLSHERKVASAISEDMDGPFAPGYQAPLELRMR